MNRSHQWFRFKGNGWGQWIAWGIGTSLIFVSSNIAQAQDFDAGARVKARQFATLLAPVSERVKAMPEMGAHFSKGDTMARFHCELPVAKQRAAKASLATAELELTIAEQEWIQGVGSQSQRDRKQALVQEKKAELQITNVTVSKCAIRAPFSGEVVHVYLEEGSSTKAGDPLVDILTLDELYIEMWAAEQNWKDFQVGQPVLIQSENINGELSGKVIKRGSHINAHRKFYIEIELDSSGTNENQIVPGMVVSVEPA